MQSLAEMVCNLNIVRFNAQLCASADEAQRKLLTTLLAEEEEASKKLKPRPT